MTNSRPHESNRPPRPNDAIPPISEAQLARLWQRRAARSLALRTESGRRVSVLYPGRPGVTAGPDFRNALLLVEEQGLVQGDVEVHLRQQDWQAHGHHNDPNYNGVALHVALQSDAEPSRTDSGATPPTVNLRDLLDDVQSEDENGSEVRARLWRILSQHGYRRPQRAEEMAALLNRAGDARFLSHSSRFQMLLPAQSPAQTLWESICEALGYRHNQHPFLRLATVAPIATLTAAARKLPPGQRSEALADCLLRIAGFEKGTLLRNLGPPLDAGQWRLFRVRPPNHPRRRIIGAAELIARFTDVGLIAGLGRAASTGKPATLTDALTAPDPRRQVRPNRRRPRQRHRRERRPPLPPRTAHADRQPTPGGRNARFIPSLRPPVRQRNHPRTCRRLAGTELAPHRQQRPPPAGPNPPPTPPLRRNIKPYPIKREDAIGSVAV